MSVESIHVPAAGVVLEADLAVPEQPAGVVLFAHGSGSGRHSPRNRHVAARLQEAGLATVLADLLTPDEERAGDLRFDIDLLAARVVALVDWASADPRVAGLGVGLFGASTGAAAALVAATQRPECVHAIVSRGGRPDLAGDFLALVRAPTLLIVGGADPVVIELNQEASEQLATEQRLLIVPGATHLFAEPGALDQVAGPAATWFTTHLTPAVP